MSLSIRRAFAAFAALLPVLATAGPAVAVTPASQTIHIELGFTTAVEFSEVESDGFLGIDWEFSVDGAGELRVDLGADVTITYDREDLLPNGMVPVEVTYTPTDDAAPEEPQG